VGQRVPPIRLIAGHLFEVATFLETLDKSIDMGTGVSMNTAQKGWTFAVERLSESKRTSLEVISEVAEGL
jgi:hypothetical protein